MKLRPTPVVYVVQENPRVDVVSAAQWGDLIPLANPYEGRVNLLKWDRLERHYYPVKISVRGGIEELTT